MKGKVCALAMVIAAVIAVAFFWPAPPSKETDSAGTDKLPAPIPPSPDSGQTPAGPPRQDDIAAPQPSPPGDIPGPQPEQSVAIVPLDPSNPLVPSTIPGVTPPAPANNDPAVMADLDKIVLMFRDYRTRMGENPVGTNAEIMKSVMGGNPKGAMLGPPEGMGVDGNGELIDRWGTPYFFHQLSRDLMEIHSAGPDKRLGTEDDLMMK